MIGLKFDRCFGEPFLYLSEYTEASFPGLWNDSVLPTAYDNTMESRFQYWTPFQSYYTHEIKGHAEPFDFIM